MSSLFETEIILHFCNRFFLAPISTPSRKIRVQRKGQRLTFIASTLFSSFLLSQLLIFALSFCDRRLGCGHNLLPNNYRILHNPSREMDSWEDADDDFVPNMPSMPSGNWDDEEEDETLKEEVVAVVELTPAQKALIKKKADQEELILANKVKNAQLENETNDQRKVRERKAVEESDSLLADELFDNIDNAHQAKKAPKTASGSIAAINLANKQDHVNFGITVATKLEKSTAFCVTAFMKEVFTRSQDRLSAEGLDELHAILTKLKDSRKIADDAKLKDKGKPKSQKAVKAKAKKAKEIFGGEYDYQDDYGDFSNMEDDFM
jgi:hypothetical protein